MAQQRVISFVDGFNLYHAISNLRRPELKWVDVRMLSVAFLRPISEKLLTVFYFSAYADHMSERAQKSQKAHIEALKLMQTVPVLGQFKNRERKCPRCNHKWMSHEEKETDVNIASFLIDLGSVLKRFFCRFWGPFEPNFVSFSGGNIDSQYIAPRKRNEIWPKWLPKATKQSFEYTPCIPGCFRSRDCYFK